jgi:hypothetical protein
MSFAAMVLSSWRITSYVNALFTALYTKENLEFGNEMAIYLSFNTLIRKKPQTSVSEIKCYKYKQFKTQS